MSKTRQRKEAAFEQGNRDAWAGKPATPKNRQVAKEYRSGYDAGKSDKARWVRKQKGIPEPVRNYEDWGPEPVDYGNGGPRREPWQGRR